MGTDKDVNYIYNYIKYYYHSVDEFNDEKYLIDISRRIRNSMINSTFVGGKLDFYINNYISTELRIRNSNSFKSFEIIKNHIYLLMNYYKIYHGVNIENYNVILYEITRIISSKYTSDDVISGNYDSLIEDMINSEIVSDFNPERQKAVIPLNILYLSSKNGEVVDSKDSIRKYIYKFVLRDINKVFEFDGDLNYLIDLITNEVCKQGVDVQKLLARKHDDMINSFIRKNMFGIRYTKLFKEVYSLVSDYVRTNETYIELSNKNEKIDMEIFRLSQYLITLGHTKEDIISGKCSETMDYHLRIDSIMVNSTICDKNEKLNPNKFPLYLNNTYSSSKIKPLVVGAVSAIMTLGTKEDNTESLENIA